MKVTGQLFIREGGKQDGRRVVMVVGILAIPEGSLLGESQYTLGGVQETNGDVIVKIMENSRLDVSGASRGISAGGMLMENIWRV